MVVGCLNQKRYTWGDELLPGGRWQENTLECTRRREMGLTLHCQVMSAKVCEVVHSKSAGQIYEFTT